jgi:MEDS: MEthanogen/methylotroph, DcmR Sensory domain
VRASHNGHFHAVRFYESTESLCRIVAHFLNEGLLANQPGLVIATPEHRAGIEEALRAQNVDVAAHLAAGDLLLLDAEEVLATFMVDGMPDGKSFQATGIEVIQRAGRGRKDCTVRAYGEMVDVLWKQGQTVAAVLLEMFWNKLATTQDFSLLCGYAMGSFYKGTQQQSICGQHTHIVGDDGMLVRAAATLH